MLYFIFCKMLLDILVCICYNICMKISKEVEMFTDRLFTCDKYNKALHDYFGCDFKAVRVSDDLSDDTYVLKSLGTCRPVEIATVHDFSDSVTWFNLMVSFFGSEYIKELNKYIYNKAAIEMSKHLMGFTGDTEFPVFGSDDTITLRQLYNTKDPIKIKTYDNISGRVVGVLVKAMRMIDRCKVISVDLVNTETGETGTLISAFGQLFKVNVYNSFGYVTSNDLAIGDEVLGCFGNFKVTGLKRLIESEPVYTLISVDDSDKCDYVISSKGLVVPYCGKEL